MSLFDSIKKISDHGQEYWLARSLAKALEYVDFGNFENVIKKAKIACEKSGQNITEHLGEVTEVVIINNITQGVIGGSLYTLITGKKSNI